MPKETAMQVSIAVEEQLMQVVRVALRTALAALPGRGEVRLGAVEEAVQQAMRQVGQATLEAVVQAVGTGYVGPSRPCPRCGGARTTNHYATPTWQTVLGAVLIRRAAYQRA